MFASILVLSLFSSAHATPEEELIDALNDYRAAVASGNTTLPAAANMNQLMWDPALAQSAAVHANNCVFTPDNNRGSRFQAAAGIASFNVPSNANPGQIIYGTTASTGLGQRAVDRWTDDEATYTYGPITQSDPLTATVWADTRYVGCAMATCPGMFGGTNDSFVVCNFFPQGNITGELPYETAGDCPDDRPERVDGMCAGCPDVDFFNTTNPSPGSSCVVHPLSCTTDSDCMSLDTCTDGDDSFTHSCVNDQCEQVLTPCMNGSCNLATCDTCTDANNDGQCDPVLTTTDMQPGQDATWTLTGSPPGSTAYFLGSTRGLGSTCGPGNAVCVDLDRAFILGSAPVNQNGRANLTIRVPRGAPAGPIAFQAVWFGQGVGDASNIVSTQVLP